jgi:hypothetical protein
LLLVRGWVDLAWRLSSEHHPTVQGRRPFLATGTRFDSRSVGDSFYDIAETYLLLFDETGQAHAMQLMAAFILWLVFF